MEILRKISLTEQEVRDLLKDSNVNIIPMQGEHGAALSIFLALSYFPHVALGIADFSEVDLFYNKYYWLLKAVRGWQRDHGLDAGLEQQAFQILEHAGIEVDWDVVEKIEQRVASEIDAKAD